MEWYIYILIIFIGIIAGFINTVAGSGSLLTLPLLMFLGLPPVSANGTNRIGILLQSLVSTGSFRQQKILDFRSSLGLYIPAVAGSLAGSIVAVDLNENAMEKAIGGLLIFMFFVILFKPSGWLRTRQTNPPLPYWLRAILFFIIGIYGGFIQAGVGFFLLAGLVLGAGYELVSANAIKALIILLLTIIALAVFIINDQVDFFIGFILGIGSMIGAWFGARYAVKWDPGFIRYFLLVAILASAVKLIFW